MPIYVHKNPDGTVSYSDKGSAGEEGAFNTLGIFVNKRELDRVRAAASAKQQRANQAAQDEANAERQKAIDKALSECEDEIGEEEDAIDGFQKDLKTATLKLNIAQLDLDRSGALLNTEIKGLNMIHVTGQVGLGAAQLVTLGESFAAKVLNYAIGKLREVGAESPEPLELGEKLAGHGEKLADYGGKVANNVDLVTDAAKPIEAGKKLGESFEKVGKGFGVVDKGISVAKIAAPIDRISTFDVANPIDDQIKQLDEISKELDKFKEGVLERATDGPRVKDIKKQIEETKEALKDLKAALDRLVELHASHNVQVVSRRAAKVGTCAQEKTAPTQFPR